MLYLITGSEVRQNHRHNCLGKENIEQSTLVQLSQELQNKKGMKIKTSNINQGPLCNSTCSF